MNTLNKMLSDGDFADWLANFYALINAAPATYGLEASEATAIGVVNTAYQTAYTTAVNPGTRTPATVAAKDAAKADALVVVRPYAVTISQNPGVTNEDKTAVGVTVKKTVPTPIPAPVDAPQVSFVSAVPLVTTLKIVNSVTPDTKAKPFGSIGVEIWGTVGTVAATDPSQLKYLFTATKIPTTIEFDAADQGKISTVAARFVTRGGNGGKAKVGPWSALLNFHVV